MVRYRCAVMIYRYNKIANYYALLSALGSNSPLSVLGFAKFGGQSIPVVKEWVFDRFALVLGNKLTMFVR
jgi:hypothetical protein